MGTKWYAVAVGKKPGVYKSWDECKLQTNGVSGADFKSFNTEDAATTWLKDRHAAASPKRARSSSKD